MQNQKEKKKTTTIQERAKTGEKGRGVEGARGEEIGGRR